MARKKPRIPPAPLVVPDHSWMDNFQIINPRKKEFLIAYETLGSVKVACKEIHLDFSQYQKWVTEKNDDGTLTPEARTFMLLMEMCAENRVVALENEARRRAFAGSDLLLIFLLKGARPHVYRDNVKVESSGPGLEGHGPRSGEGLSPVPIQIQTPEHLARVMDLAEKYGLKDRLFPKQVLPDVTPSGGKLPESTDPKVV